MAVAIQVQNDNGTVTGANAYVTVAAFKAYCDLRGYAYASPVAYTDDQIAVAIIKATDYVDGRFKFRGTRRNDPLTQPTQFPRANAWDDDGRGISGIHPALKNAVCEYAFRALTGVTLNPDPVRDSSGQAVKSFSKKAGPVEQSYEYANAGSVTFPRYPLADRMLANAGLLASSNGETVRG